MKYIKKFESFKQFIPGHQLIFKVPNVIKSRFKQIDIDVDFRKWIDMYGGHTDYKSLVFYLNEDSINSKKFKKELKLFELTDKDSNNFVVKSYLDKVIKKEFNFIFCDYCGSKSNSTEITSCKNCGSNYKNLTDDKVRFNSKDDAIDYIFTTLKKYFFKLDKAEKK